MNIFAVYQNQISDLVGHEVVFVVEIPTNPQHGDFSTNVALVLSKVLKKNPMTIAEDLLNKLKQNKLFMQDVLSVELAKPGFINWKVNLSFWYRNLFTIISSKERYGSLPRNNKKISIEHISANPTGPLHIGHARVAVIGDVLCNFMEFMGYEVNREYYVNDLGNQIGVLGFSLYVRYLEVLEESDESLVRDEQNFYPGEYLINVASDLAKVYGKLYVKNYKEDFFRQFAINAIMNLIKEDLSDMGVNYNLFLQESILEKPINDKFFLEKHREYEGFTWVDLVVDILKRKDLLYYGTLPKPKTNDDQSIKEWQEREQLLLKTTLAGDEVDRPLQRSDGSWTYFLRDVAYHYYRFVKNYHKLINVWGADHAGHINKMYTTYNWVTGSNNLQILVCNLVNFVDQGVPIRMSKRAGLFITLADLINNVGSDAIKIMMLSRKESANIEFDLAKVNEENEDNYLFYIQYSYARICSLRRHFFKTFNTWPDMDLTKDNPALIERYFLNICQFLNNPKELEIIKYLLSWPKVCLQILDHLELHRLMFYLYDLAGLFSSWWGEGHRNRQLRFIDVDNFEKSLARLNLCLLIAKIMENVAQIIGITLKEEM